MTDAERIDAERIDAERMDAERMDAESRQLLARITWTGAALGVAGGLTLWIANGPRWGAGFILGAGVSMLALEWWKMIGKRFDDSGKRPVAASGALLTLRLPVIAGFLYVIVKFTGVASGAVIGGLLVSLTATVVEVLRQAAASKH